MATRAVSLRLPHPSRLLVLVTIAVSVIEVEQRPGRHVDGSVRLRPFAAAVLEAISRCPRLNLPYWGAMFDRTYEFTCSMTSSFRSASGVMCPLSKMGSS